MTEQNATASRIEEYARRWFIWVRSGVPRVELGKGEEGAIDLHPTYSLFCSVQLFSPFPFLLIFVLPQVFFPILLDLIRRFLLLCDPHHQGKFQIPIYSIIFLHISPHSQRSLRMYSFQMPAPEKKDYTEIPLH